MTKDELDKYKELEFVVEKLVDYCNNVGIATACELIAVEAALERLYKARQKESEKDMTNVINNGGPAFPEAGARGRASGGEGMTPDLLEVLEELLSMCQRQEDFNDDGDGCMFERASAAIAKARGER